MKKILSFLLINTNILLSAQSKIDMQCHYDELTAEGQGKSIVLVRKYFENNTPDSIYKLLDNNYIKSAKDLEKNIANWTAELSKHYKPFSFNIGGFQCMDDCKNHFITLSYSKNGSYIYFINLYFNHKEPNSKIYKIEFENKLKEYLEKQNQEGDLMPPEPE